MSLKTKLFTRLFALISATSQTKVVLKAANPQSRLGKTKKSSSDLDSATSLLIYGYFIKNRLLDETERLSTLHSRNTHTHHMHTHTHSLLSLLPSSPPNNVQRAGSTTTNQIAQQSCLHRRLKRLLLTSQLLC